MAYATATDLLNVIGDDLAAQLTTDVGGVPDEDLIAEVLADGAGRMDSYLGRRLPLPLTAPYPRDLQRINVDLAIYFLMTRRPGLVIESLRRHYEDGLAWLREFASGKVELIGLTDLAAEDGGSAQPQVDGPEQVFTEDVLSGF